MSERFEGKRKLLTGLKISAGAAFGALLVACGSDKTPPPPEGFSRNSADYSWSIRVDIEQTSDSNNYAQLFTNKKPVLTSEGGINHVVGEDVFCKDSSNWRGREAGCTFEFMRNWEISSPKRISVADNKGIK